MSDEKWLIDWDVPSRDWLIFWYGKPSEEGTAVMHVEARTTSHLTAERIANLPVLEAESAALKDQVEGLKEALKPLAPSAPAPEAAPSPSKRCTRPGWCNCALYDRNQNHCSYYQPVDETRVGP